MDERRDRLQAILHQEISQIVLQELKDPRIGFTTVTRVKLAGDLRSARVLVSVLGSEEDARRSVEGLRSARTYVQALLGRRIRLKFVPRLGFEIDTALAEGDRIYGLIEDLQLAPDEQSDDDQGSGPES